LSGKAKSGAPSAIIARTFIQAIVRCLRAAGISLLNNLATLGWDPKRATGVAAASGHEIQLGIN
jgi:hypothetical protein